MEVCRVQYTHRRIADLYEEDSRGGWGTQRAYAAHDGDAKSQGYGAQDDFCDMPSSVGHCLVCTAVLWPECLLARARQRLGNWRLVEIHGARAGFRELQRRSG